MPPEHPSVRVHNLTTLLLPHWDTVKRIAEGLGVSKERAELLASSCHKALFEALSDQAPSGTKVDPDPTPSRSWWFHFYNRDWPDRELEDRVVIQGERLVKAKPGQGSDGYVSTSGMNEEAGIRSYLVTLDPQGPLPTMWDHLE